MSLVKTRLRASCRGEIPSTVGVRQPNPYENVRIFLECAIYQTHVNIKVVSVGNSVEMRVADRGVQTDSLRADYPKKSDL